MAEHTRSKDTQNYLLDLQTTFQAEEEATTQQLTDPREDLYAKETILIQQVVDTRTESSDNIDTLWNDMMIQFKKVQQSLDQLSVRPVYTEIGQYSSSHGVLGHSPNSTHTQVVVDFTASWCGPCRLIAPVFVELAEKFTNVIFLKVDVDELKTVAQEWKIAAMPTFIFLKDGEVVEKMVGDHKGNLLKKIELHVNK